MTSRRRRHADRRLTVRFHRCLMRMRRGIVVVMLAAITTLTARAPAPIVAAPYAQGIVSELPITFPIQSAEALEYFNQIARPNDLAALPTPYLELLPQIQAGRTMVIFRSWAEAEQQLDGLVGQVDAIAYNPEHWEFTPMTEQESLPATLQRAGDVVRERGFEFVFVPDRRFAEDSLRETAPHADAVILQGQRLQSDPQAFSAWMQAMIAVARESNPQIQIYAQVGATQGTGEEMLTAIETVAGDIDGIAVWTLPQTFSVLQDFVTIARAEADTATPAGDTTPGPTAVAPTHSPTTPPTETVSTTTPTQEASATMPVAPTNTQTAAPTPSLTPTVVTRETVVPAPTLTPEPTPAAGGNVWGQRIVLIVLGLLIGIGIGVFVRRWR